MGCHRAAKGNARGTTHVPGLSSPSSTGLVPCASAWTRRRRGPGRGCSAAAAASPAPPGPHRRRRQPRSAACCHCCLWVQPLCPCWGRLAPRAAQLDSGPSRRALWPVHPATATGAILGAAAQTGRQGRPASQERGHQAPADPIEWWFELSPQALPAPKASAAAARPVPRVYRSLTDPPRTPGHRPGGGDLLSASGSETVSHCVIRVFYSSSRPRPAGCPPLRGAGVSAVSGTPRPSMASMLDAGPGCPPCAA